MKIARFLYKRRIYWGRVQKDLVLPLAKGTCKDLISISQKAPLSKIKFLPPANPSKIILVGLNYREHARELNMPLPKEPIIFMKPNTTLLADRQAIKYPQGVGRLDYEAELALVIKKRAKSIPQKEVAKYILGYTCLNDVTARDLQKKDGQWTRAKSFDGFCPLGPWLETELDPQNQKIKLYLNGRIKQESSTANFIFPIKQLVSFISRVMTLLPGDVISTGTPSGVGRMKKGDLVQVEVSDVGRLSNRVI
jgi:2-keto-4-pentenoate hydratase/2-oxohepta-3-ene-1,7-dioic acid hydratase in catechol pathway